ncbi:MAG TPA: hypothetical protein VKX16_19110 [Chloroflexota bacterium]|nr:hypothetical protein [Chloroflexota bacterium]
MIASASADPLSDFVAARLHLPRRLLPLAPYTYQIMLVLVIPLAFWLDSLTRTVAQQDVLGACAWVLLVVFTRFSSRQERRQVWIMVGVATCVEVWSSIIWGVYQYRFGNLPLFVPPGHGLVYLFALRSVRTPLALRYARGLSRAAIACATVWALFGLTLEPALLHRLDLMGAMWWPIFVWFMRKPSAPVFAAAFFVTSYLELWGTHIGTWTWQLYTPISHIPDGNPPSVISAGYCLMDFTSITLAAALPSMPLLDRWRTRREPEPATVEAA